MVLEVLFFRSLFRNLRADLQGKKLIYGSAKWLWLGAILFHWSFLIILIRHLRLFTNPVPSVIQFLDYMDSFIHSFGVPPVYITDILIIAGLSFLLLRRLVDAKVSYISHGSDYFPLFLILGIVITGVLMRYNLKIDVYAVKHLFLVSVLAAYFPFSKLVHMIGVFFSPTRNMPNNNRAEMHVNPWNYPVKHLTYAEWQERFREVMENAGIPIDEEVEKEEHEWYTIYGPNKNLNL
jgi:nitrate reductase gamma subunit